MLEQYLHTLFSELQLGTKPSKDKEGLFWLQLEPHTKVAFRLLDPVGFFLFGEIAPCPAKKKEELFSFLMRANFLGLGTGGSTISLDAEEKFLTLSQALTYDNNYRDFKETVEIFVNFLDYWRDELEKLAKQDT